MFIHFSSMTPYIQALVNGLLIKKEATNFDKTNVCVPKSHQEKVRK